MCKIVESFSQLSIPFQRIIVRNRTPAPFQEDMYELSNEVVIDMKLQKKVGSYDTARLLGLNANYLSVKTLDASSKYLIESMSEFERQVYLQPS